jgi:hypothetical protein
MSFSCLIRTNAFRIIPAISCIKISLNDPIFGKFIETYDDINSDDDIFFLVRKKSFRIIPQNINKNISINDPDFGEFTESFYYEVCP